MCYAFLMNTQSFPKTDRLLLVDGSNLLFQMFFGMPARITGKDNQAIQGTLGFVGALLKIIRMTRPTHLAVLFDGEHENPRAELDAGYKANRPDFGEVPEEENPFSQLPDVYAALDFLGISHTETVTCETDDVIAGYALTYGQQMDVVISSFDSDFFQLVTDRVSVLRYRGEKTVLCTPATIHEKFGIAPGQYADFKSLTGDTADNIKGVPKVGPKTAAGLISTFGSLQGVLAHANEIARPGLRQSVLESAQRLQVNYRLIKLTGDAPLPFALPALAYIDQGLTTTQVLTAIGLK